MTQHRRTARRTVRRATRRATGRGAVPTAALLAVCCLAGHAVAAGVVGPSTVQGPYLEGTAAGVTTTSILNAGDDIGGYLVAGTPDGLGAWDNGDGTFTVVVNHEFRDTVGGPRSHGNTGGSFISRFVVDSESLEVLRARDQIRRLVLADPEGSADLDRLCSADLAGPTAFFDATSGRGFRGRVFLNGEESGPSGRAFAHVLSGTHDGTSYELPDLGRAAWENLAASPSTRERTVVVGQSDGGTHGVYVYVGEKSSTGDPMTRAGLSGGTSRALAVEGMPREDATTPYRGGTRSFGLVAEGSPTATTFRRPEDGAWDTRDPDVYYFATSASTSEHSRLWRMTFTDAARPELGGTIDVVTEGPAVPAGTDETTVDGPLMLDNVTVAPGGTVLVQEDPGGSAYRSGIFAVDPDTGEARRVAQHAARYFSPDGADFITTNEESSGIIPAGFLGADTFLVSEQVHAGHPGPDADRVVQRGQLLSARIPLPDLRGTEPVTLPPRAIEARLSGRHNAGRDDRLLVDAPRAARGATARLVRLTRQGPRRVAAATLNRFGNARFVVRDTNRRQVTRYRVRVVGNDVVAGTWSNRRRVR